MKHKPLRCKHSSVGICIYCLTYSGNPPKLELIVNPKFPHCKKCLELDDNTNCEYHQNV